MNSAGEVVGVNTAILSRTGGSHGIGFAVPSNHVTQLLAEARRRGSNPPVATPRPGPGPSPAPDRRSAFLGILGDDFRGRGVAAVRIRQVVPGSPADEAGLRRGDVILEVNQEPVGDAAEFRDALEEAERGALLLVHRGGTQIYVPLKR